MATEGDKQKYDSFGFPIPENKSSGSSNTWLKVFLWSLLVFFILFYFMTGILASYVAYSSNLGDPTGLLVMKVLGAFMFNWFYLGYKGVEKLLYSKL